MDTKALRRPLGIRADAYLAPEQLQALTTLASYDLSAVRQRLARDLVVPPAWIDTALLEFRRYLGLVVVCETPLMMFSKQVDEVWHVCLLHSRLYADLCETVFGHFVHHEPAGQPAGDLDAAWQEFESAYMALYGELGRLWLMAHPSRP